MALKWFPSCLTPSIEAVSPSTASINIESVSHTALQTRQKRRIMGSDAASLFVG